MINIIKISDIEIKISLYKNQIIKLLIKIYLKKFI